MTQAVVIEPVREALPADIGLLRAESLGEGQRHVARLVDAWEDGSARFGKTGEVLLAARVPGRTIGVGGLTQDPYTRGVLRMRRFYVSPGWRRHGIGRRIAEAAIASVPRHVPVTVHAPSDPAVAFWRSLGFAPVEAEHHNLLRPPVRR